MSFLSRFVRFSFGKVANLSVMSAARMPVATRPKIANTSTAMLMSRVMYQFSKNKQYHQTVNRSVDKGDGYMMEQLLTGCLSLFSYYIESEGEAIIIDPINEIDKYLYILKERKTKLKYIFLTHFHADYVAGHLYLKNKFKGAEIVMGPKSKISAYDVRVAYDGEDLPLGSVKVRVIHTPGHTEYSSCLVLFNKYGRIYSVFTGDTMFLNYVGRPDLAVKSDLTSKDLAFMLFDSLKKIKELPSHTKIYPGHGAGSSCGKSIGKGDFCTLEKQLKSNYAFKFHDKEKFAEEILRGMPAPPQYFFNVVSKNKKEPFQFDYVFNNANKPLTIDQFKYYMHKPNTHVIDIRGSNYYYHKGVLKGSYFIGHYGPFANFVGLMLDPTHNYLVFGDSYLVHEAIKRLIRIGFTNIKGYNNFSIKDLNSKDIIRYKLGSLHDLKKAQRHDNDYTILDVRNPSEWYGGVFEGKVLKVPLHELQQSIKEGKLSIENKYLVHCASGYRAKIAATILLPHNYEFAILEDPLSHYTNNGATLAPNQPGIYQETMATKEYQLKQEQK